MFNPVRLAVLALLGLSSLAMAIPVEAADAASVAVTAPEVVATAADEPWRNGNGGRDGRGGDWDRGGRDGRGGDWDRGGRDGRGGDWDRGGRDGRGGRDEPWRDGGRDGRGGRDEGRGGRGGW